jgi:hypothetical protein
MKNRLTASTATNKTRNPLKLANRAPNASTVPKSLTKHAARIILPNSVWFGPVSIITAYTTATEVVDSAIPAIHA